MSNKKSGKPLPNQTRVATPPADSAAPRTSFNIKYLYWFLLAIYAIFICWAAGNHEPWRDEAQSWLLVRALNLPELFKILPQEAHPPTWYLLIMPFAKMGMPYSSEAWITVIIMILAVYVLLFKTSLPVYLKIALLFSYYFGYEYAAISRNYCLVALFVSLVLAVYPKRFEQPWLFALVIVGLFNSHVIAFTLAASLAGIYFIDLLQEKKANGNTLGALALMAIGGGYLIPYFLLNSASGAYQNRITDHMLEIKKAINAAFFVYEDLKTLSLILLVILAALLIQRPKALLVLVGGLVGVCYILGYKYVGTLRHQGILLFVVLAAYGVAAYYKEDRFNLKTGSADLVKYGYILLAIIGVYQIKTTVGAFSADNENAFSDAKATAEFLKENNLEHNIIIGYPSWATSSILPFLPADVKFYYPDCDRYGSYIVYDSCFMKSSLSMSGDVGPYTALRVFKDKLDKVVVISNLPIADPQIQGYFKLVHTAEGQPMKKDESFYVYRYSGPFPVK